MKRPCAVVCFFLPVALFGQALTLGNLEVKPGKTLYFGVPLRSGTTGAPAVRGALVVPEKFDPRKSWPVLVIDSPGNGSPIDAMRGFTNVAWQSGWLVLAADDLPGKPKRDSFAWRWTLISSALDYVHKFWPGSRDWPMACAGFSGGAKMSAFTAAHLVQAKYRVIGLFLGGCNDDMASLAYQQIQPGENYKTVPVMLSSGAGDAIATPAQHESVKSSMLREGFTNVWLETHQGAHALDTNHLQRALEWFSRQAADSADKR
jgi:hypothetical protein